MMLKKVLILIFLLFFSVNISALGIFTLNNTVFEYGATDYNFQFNGLKYLRILLDLDFIFSGKLILDFPFYFTSNLTLMHFGYEKLSDIVDHIKLLSIETYMGNFVIKQLKTLNLTNNFIKDINLMYPQIKPITSGIYNFKVNNLQFETFLNDIKNPSIDNLYTKITFSSLVYKLSAFLFEKNKFIFSLDNEFITNILHLIVNIEKYNKTFLSFGAKVKLKALTVNLYKNFSNEDTINGYFFHNFFHFKSKLGLNFRITEGIKLKVARTFEGSNINIIGFKLEPAFSQQLNVDLNYMKSEEEKFLVSDINYKFTDNTSIKLKFTNKSSEKMFGIATSLKF